MRKLILIILLTLAYSQPQIEWESTFDNIGFSDKANYIQETIDGVYILKIK